MKLRSVGCALPWDMAFSSLPRSEQQMAAEIELEVIYYLFCNYTTQ